MNAYGRAFLHAVFIVKACTLGAYAQIINTQTPVQITFDDISDFQNGVLGINKTITISTLVGFSNKNLVVATAGNLTSGSAQVPANIVRVTSVGSGWTDRAVFLNTSTAQTVTAGMSLAILSGARRYTLRYEVPSPVTLFNRADGTYTTTVTYRTPGLIELAATARINLRIQNVLAISSNFNPSFTVDNPNEYQNGISMVQTGALTVTSTRDYDIQVRASGPFSSGSRTLASNHMRIAVLNAGGTISGSVPLTTAGSQIVNEGTAALAKPLDIRYELAGGNHLLNLPNAAYSTTLTYTISVD